MFYNVAIETNTKTNLSKNDRSKPFGGLGRQMYLSLTLVGLIGGIVAMVTGIALWVLHAIYPQDGLLDRLSSLLAGGGLLLLMLGAMFVDKLADHPGNKS